MKTVRRCLDCQTPLHQHQGAGRHRLRCDSCRAEIKAAGHLGVRRCLSCDATLAYGSRKTYCGRCRPNRVLPMFDRPDGDAA